MGTFGKLHKHLGADKVGSNYFVGQDKSKRGLKKFELLTKINELIHNMGIVYFGSEFIADLRNENYINAVADGVGILMNFYLIMLQRYNRARIYNTLDNLARRNPAS